MGRPRADILLHALDDEEIGLLRDDIGHSGRKGLDTLLSFLLDRNAGGAWDQDDRAAMFRNVFDRPYTEGEDYLLRNELRLLSERIYDLIAQREHRAALERTEGIRAVALLRGLARRKEYGAFESLYRRFLAQAIEALDLRTALELNDLYVNYLIHYHEITPERMRQVREVLLENLVMIKKIYRRDVSLNQHLRIVCAQNLRVMGSDSDTTTIGLDVDLSESDTPLALFYDHLSHAHLSSGNERIDHACKAVEAIAPIRSLFNDRAILGDAILSSAYLAEGRYREARDSFQEAIDFARREGIDPPIEMLFNYVSTLMRLDDFQKALELLDRYAQALAERPQIRFRAESLRCFCHIFQNEPIKALESIPPDLGQRPESEHNYFRFIYLIIPYLRNEPEDALREARNFLGYFNRHERRLQFPQEKKIATMFRSFYNAVYTLTDPDRRRKGIRRVLDDITAFVKANPGYRDYLYLRWLEREGRRMGAGL